MSYVVLSAVAELDISRFYDFLEPNGHEVADTAITAIFASLRLLETMPLSGPPVEEASGLRKFVTSYGSSGYVAFYTYDRQTDTAAIVKIFHQREKYTIGILNAL
jgi:plasmid stabilization system protein ParE